MTVSVLGCGWLGAPLGSYLVEKGLEVKGSTTKAGKMRLIGLDGIDPYLIKLHPDTIQGDILAFLDTDVLVLNFPPSATGQPIEKAFPATVERVLGEVKKTGLRKILFVSSTSVYGDQAGKTVTEATPLEPSYHSGKALLQVEDRLRDDADLDVTILRMGGLIGGNRQPHLFLRGRKDLQGGNMPVNLLHQEDAIRAIAAIIEQDCWGETFNVVADTHPLRREYYTTAATRRNLIPPQFVADTSLSGKTVSNAKIKTMLNFEFRYNDPYLML
ncbi:MAG: NAD-dependent epimerase/dehydratase family protein [Bacteroidia bacterium]